MVRRRQSSTVLTARRLLEYADLYYDVQNKSFPEGESKRALLRILTKKSGRADAADGAGGAEKRKKKKRKAMDANGNPILG